MLMIRNFRTFYTIGITQMSFNCIRGHGHDFSHIFSPCFYWLQWFCDPFLTINQNLGVSDRVELTNLCYVNKARVFLLLSALVQYTGKNLFEPIFYLLIRFEHNCTVPNVCLVSGFCKYFCNDRHLHNLHG